MGSRLWTRAERREEVGVVGGRVVEGVGVDGGAGGSAILRK